MTLLDVRGRLIKKNMGRFLIEWDSKSRSIPQFATKQFLKPFWENHIVYEEFPVYGTLLKVDILNVTVRIAIEINGPQHEKFNPFFHTTPHGYLKSIKNDFKKREWLEKNNFQLIEINTDEVKKLSKEFAQEKFGLLL